MMPTFNKTEQKFFKGKVSWVKAITPDMKFGPPGKWGLQLHPDPDSLEAIRDLQARGLKNMLKKDEDNQYYINFSRPVNRTYKGAIKAFVPPVITDKEGKPLEQPIGNGSDATIQVEIYEHGTPGGGKAVAARWVGARIDNLIPFNKDTDYPDGEGKIANGLTNQPEHAF